MSIPRNPIDLLRSLPPSRSGLSPDELQALSTLLSEAGLCLRSVALDPNEGWLLRVSVAAPPDVTAPDGTGHEGRAGPVESASEPAQVEAPPSGLQDPGLASEPAPSRGDPSSSSNPPSPSVDDPLPLPNLEGGEAEERAPDGMSSSPLPPPLEEGEAAPSKDPSEGLSETEGGLEPPSDDSESEALPSPLPESGELSSVADALEREGDPSPPGTPPASALEDDPFTSSVPAEGAGDFDPLTHEGRQELRVPPPSSKGRNPFRGRSEDPEDRARRLARTIVGDIIAYGVERHREALEQGIEALRSEFAEDIDHARTEFLQQIDEERVSDPEAIFREAVNQILGNDQEVL